LNAVIDARSCCNEIRQKISLPSYRDAGTLTVRGRCRPSQSSWWLRSHS